MKPPNASHVGVCSTSRYMVQIHFLIYIKTAKDSFVDECLLLNVCFSKKNFTIKYCEATNSFSTDFVCSFTEDSHDPVVAYRIVGLLILFT